MNKITKIYHALLKEHGHQGWWPVKGEDDLKSEYHKKDYSYPRNEDQAFEIMAGAILTQSTSWKNVANSIDNLRENNVLDAETINRLPLQKLAQLIKSSGYHNQKAKKLKAFVKFYIKHMKNADNENVTRDKLLGIWGIGPETADSILLYALKKPYFVVDEYTRRIFLRLGFFEKNEKYDAMQKMFHENLPLDFKLFNEYHALIVEHAKVCCTKNKSGDCVLDSIRNQKRHLFATQKGVVFGGALALYV